MVGLLLLSPLLSYSKKPIPVRVAGGQCVRLLQDTIDRPAGARQALALQLLIARQVVQDRFGPWRSLQALWWLIAHLENALNHGWADPLGRMLAGPRATAQHLLVFWPTGAPYPPLGRIGAASSGDAVASGGAGWPALRSILLP